MREESWLCCDMNIFEKTHKSVFEAPLYNISGDVTSSLLFYCKYIYNRVNFNLMRPFTRHHIKSVFSLETVQFLTRFETLVLDLWDYLPRFKYDLFIEFMLYILHASVSKEILNSAIYCQTKHQNPEFQLLTLSFTVKILLQISNWTNSAGIKWCSFSGSLVFICFLRPWIVNVLLIFTVSLAVAGQFLFFLRNP